MLNGAYDNEFLSRTGFEGYKDNKVQSDNGNDMDGQNAGNQCL